MQQKHLYMATPKTEGEKVTNQLKVEQNEPAPTPENDERDRLRDIIVVFITYPLTPGGSANEAGRKHPWLEVFSLVLKAALAAYAIYLGR